MSKQKEYAITIINDYIDYVDFMYQYGRKSYDERSYATFIGNEIIELIKTNEKPPLIVIENLKFTIQQYPKTNKITSYVFSIILTSIDDIIDNLCN